MIVIIQVTKYEITPIQDTHNTNDNGANFRKILLLQHLTDCSCSGKLLESFEGALKNITGVFPSYPGYEIANYLQSLLETS